MVRGNHRVGLAHCGMRAMRMVSPGYDEGDYGPIPADRMAVTGAVM